MPEHSKYEVSNRLRLRNLRKTLARALPGKLKRFQHTVAGARNYFSRDQSLNRKAAVAASRLQLLPTIEAAGLATSISDYSEYRQIVAAAAKDDLAFSLFRSHQQYFPILEHVSKKQGDKYLEIVRSRSNVPKNWAKECRPLNVLGSPQKYTYPKIKRFSPTILRYVKVYSDLELLFGPLRGLRCAEIGIGFGGQAAVLRLLGKVGELNLYDLPPVLKLAERFLKNCNANSSISFLDGSAVAPAQRVDLLVSNYAFSELTRELQFTYLENVIAKASMGYITWNSLSPDGISLEELLGLIPESQVLEEEPKTHPDNVILIWGSDRTL